MGLGKGSSTVLGFSNSRTFLFRSFLVAPSFCSPVVQTRCFEISGFAVNLEFLAANDHVAMPYKAGETLEQRLLLLATFD